MGMFIKVFVLCLCSVAAYGQAQLSMDANLPFEARIDYLLANMTLEEKVSQMQHESPAIERLGIPAYNWWNEALHGVVPGGVSTVFPQAIGLAATWNTDMHYEIATAISDEARAKYHESIRTGNTAIYCGLTFWSPNINIFRDPRWGRGQETYGEDPYLTSRFGVAFVKGLQGDDPNYLKTVATPKHFAVHSGPENLRHSFDATVSEYDLYDTYLYAFKACVQEGKAVSVMSAYSGFNREPSTGSYNLLTKILRKDWGFNGYVVSDCDSAMDLYSGHKIVPTSEEAAAMSANAGCDLNCGQTYSSLSKAVKLGFIKEEQINSLVRSLFMARYRLGMFDPAEKIKYSQIPFSVNDSPGHKELAREAARQSIVLLKNKGDILPLRKNIKTIAVIGPAADSTDVLLGNYNGTPSKSVTILAGIKQAVDPNTQVLYAKGCEIVDDIESRLQDVPANVFFTDANCSQAGVKAEYYDNMDLKGSPVLSRIDAQPSLGWIFRSSIPNVPFEGFSVRWTGVLVAPESGKYYVAMESFHGHRLYLNDKLITENWSDEYGSRDKAVAVELEKGKPVSLRIEFYHNKFMWAGIGLKWATEIKTDFTEAIKAAKQADVVILAMGISAKFESEESLLSCDGFSCGDRTSLDLPKVQQRLIEEVYALKKPTVLLLTSGSMFSINWANKNIPAILQLWYPGQSGGNAAADVIFGDYNPAGRLPITAYKSLNDLPPFNDYRMTNRTYRYFKGKPLYPFGFGLSYTSFSYNNLSLDRQNDTVTVRIDVTNTGKRNGDEVVQVYVSPEDAKGRLPLLALRSFKRINIIAGQTQTVELKLSPEQQTFFDEKGKPFIPDKVTISVGGGLKFISKKLKYAFNNK